LRDASPKAAATVIMKALLNRPSAGSSGSMYQDRSATSQLYSPTTIQQRLRSLRPARRHSISETSKGDPIGLRRLGCDREKRQMGESVIRATDSDHDAGRPGLPAFGFAALVLPRPEMLVWTAPERHRNVPE